MSQEERLKLLERACEFLNLRIERNSSSNWRIIDYKSASIWLDNQIRFDSIDLLLKRFLKTEVLWSSHYWETTFPAELIENKVYDRQGVISDVEVKTGIIVDSNSVVKQLSNPFYGMTEEELAVKLDLDSSTASENRA